MAQRWMNLKTLWKSIKEEEIDRGNEEINGCYPFDIYFLEEMKSILEVNPKPRNRYTKERDASLIFLDLNRMMMR